jgi:hypothetical protein
LPDGSRLFRLYQSLSRTIRATLTSSMCKTALALRFNGRKRHAIRSRRGGRLVQWTAGRRRSRRDSRLIVKTSPRFTVNWPALASSILEDSGPAFTNRRCGAISPVRSVPDPPASTAPRAREGIKTHARKSISSYTLQTSRTYRPNRKPWPRFRQPGRSRSRYFVRADIRSYKKDPPRTTRGLSPVTSRRSGER